MEQSIKEESEIKNILLALVEPNRNSPTDNIPADVKGWRFPSGSTDASRAGDGEKIEEQYQQPVCFWTGVACDPIDGSITGLNLGNGFYVETLLGMSASSSKAGDEGGKQQHTRVMIQQYDDEIILHKKRYPESSSIITNDRRTANDVPPRTTSPSFPSSLGKLTSLRFLNLSHNQLQGSIPRSIVQLPNLEMFDVTSNDLEGTFPHFESDALRVLDMSKNRFHGRLDEDLFRHPDIGPYTAPYLLSLVKFDLSHNGFNGTIPLDGTSGFYNPDVEHEGSLQNLQYFDLGYNLFSGTICNNFGNFENLQGLFLEHNRLVGTIPKSIFRGSGLGAHPLPLVQLFLEQNSLSGTLNEGLATLPNLKELYVDGNKLTGVVPEPLCNLELNDIFLNSTEAAQRCDGISCPVNCASREGVAPCTPCPNDGGFHRYMGQHDSECRGGMSEVEILDLFFEQTHGDEWLDLTYLWEKGSATCQRKGVECNAAGQVTKITLQSLGLRGPLILELGFLSKLQVLDLPNNQLTGFLPSDLRFVPLNHLDIRGSRVQGVVPPLLCIKEGVNGNGIRPPGMPPGSIDFNLLYACENIACPRGTYSSIGRASLPENEGEDGIHCLPCYDDQATFYMGRAHCTDVSIAGLQIRTDDIRRGLVKSIPVILVLAFLAMLSRIRLYHRKSSASATPRNENSDSDGVRMSQRSSLPLQLWTSSPVDDEYSDDDWTAGYSESEGVRPVKRSIELPQRKSRLPTVI